MDKVIFDTNAYRYLVTDKSFEQIDKLIQKLKSKEKKNNIETLISSVVAQELLAHVADKNDPSYEKCLKAIKALYLHSGNKESYNMIASLELILAKSYFNVTIPAKIETNKAIGEMIYHIATNPIPKTFKKLNANLQASKSHVLGSEYYFAMQMKQFVTATDPDATGWQIFANDPKKRELILTQIRSKNSSIQIAMGFLYVVYQLLLTTGQTAEIDHQKLLDMAKSVAENFPEPISLFKQVMENLVNSEFNLFENSRSNFVWDIQLMFNVGNHSVGGSKLYFVTSDKAMIRTAVKENAKLTILTYDEYIEYLKK